MIEQVLQILLSEEVISGEKMSHQLGVTRTAVWKDINSLKELGFEIEADRQGYRLVSCPDTLMVPVIENGLITKWAGKTIISLDSVDSTNRYLKKLAAEGAEAGTLVLADEQTLGRGRRGRGWMTPKGEGLAISLLLRPQIPSQRVAMLSLATSVVVARAISNVTNLPAKIKWPNDIIINGHKACGLLLEMDANEQTVNYVVAGVGINVHQQEFPEEIAMTATSLDKECGHFVNRASLVQELLRETENVEQFIREDRLLEIFRPMCVTIGECVNVIGVNETFEGFAEDVTDSGSLLVRDDLGEIREVLAGDVSVRGLMGYV